MAKTPSTMVALGTLAPDFFLPEVRHGQKVGLHDVTGKYGLVVMFLSKHCPYVQHILPTLTQLTQDYIPKGLRFVGISSNDVSNYPEDHPTELAKMAGELNWRFPLLYDETQEVARAYNAACTPDFFVYDQQLQLVYRGQLDNSRPGNGEPCDGNDLKNALDALLGGKKPNPDQKPSLGCNIKWKS